MNILPKFYRGRRNGNQIDVDVVEDENYTKPLTHISHHSPDGFEWGYGGSGPADLALAILVDLLDEDPKKVLPYALAGKGEPSAAVHAHQKFKDKFIVDLPTTGNIGDKHSTVAWKLEASTLKEWYYSEIGALCLECKRGMKESDGCRLFGIPMKDGSTGDPIKHGEEKRAYWGRDGHRCHDCGAKVGHYHHPGCDVEECPGCGGQLIGCECLATDEEENGTEERLG